jgi:hypothetical protein
MGADQHAHRHPVGLGIDAQLVGVETAERKIGDSASPSPTLTMSSLTRAAATPRAWCDNWSDN